MPDSGGGCCRCCCSFIFTLGLTALFMWLSLRASAPKCFLQKFFIPSLNQTLNSRGNDTLYFQLRLENTNKDKGVYYDRINVTFFDNPSKNHSVGYYTVINFYQGHKKKATKGGEIFLSKSSGFDRDKVYKAVSNGSAIWRVDMETSVRYKIMAWQTKRYKISVGANINISTQGTLPNPKKKLRLKSNGFRVQKFSNFWVCFWSFVFIINLL